MLPSPRPRVAVATSGGRDSTALLHCVARAAADLGIEVLALHVHHGLMAQADDWQAHVQRQCRRWGVALRVARLDGAPMRGDSVEAWARRERYAALARLAQEEGVTLVLLAQHRRDQAETFLLQALRGAGPAGLAAMPRSARRAGVVWARPWLEQPREAIEAYVRRHRLRFIDDASNADPRFARARLRATVWPALGDAFGQAEQALAAAAARSAQAAQALAELAALDLEGAADEGSPAGALALPRWLGLSPARRANALRAWLPRAGVEGAPETLLERLLEELPRARSARWPAPGGELRLHRGVLRFAPEEPPAVAFAPPLLASIDLRRSGGHRLPGWAGRLHVERAREGGVPARALQSVQLRPREGGERFRLAPRASARSLKKQYQALGVPAWQRQGPLLFTADGALLFVPGLGIEASQQAAPGAPQLRLSWVPDCAPATGKRQGAE